MKFTSNIYNGGYLSNLNAIANNKIGIYIIIDKNNRTKYIGKSSDLKQRLNDHFTNGKLINSDSVSIYEFESESKFPKEIHDYLLIIEECLIKNLKPSLNILYNKTKSCYSCNYKNPFVHENMITKIEIILNIANREATLKIYYQNGMYTDFDKIKY